MKRFIIALAAFSLVCAPVHAQNFLKKLGDRTKDAVERKVENKVNQEVDNAVDRQLNKVFDKKEKNDSTWTCPKCKKKGNTGKFCANCGTAKPGDGKWVCPNCGKKDNDGKFCADCGTKKPEGEAKPQGQGAPKEEPKAAAQPKADSPLTAQIKEAKAKYAKCDFVPGDEVFFEDPVQNEKLGEFPLNWDLVSGEECEIANIGGGQAIKLSGWYSQIAPNMKEADYLPEEFTIEFEVLAPSTEADSNNDHLDIVLYSEDTEKIVELTLNPAYSTGRHADIVCNYISPKGDSRVSTADGALLKNLIKENSWVKVQMSFNKRAFKYYVNGNRMINLPNVMRPTRMLLQSAAVNEDRFFIRNIRICKGAVPLYDRLISDGKIVSYNITFETGKADLKEESIIELQRIASLMLQYPDLEFEVQGHTDNTGSDKVNDPLSQERAETIVAALVELGVEPARLTAVGKGSREPAASNNSADGRAKNRRVEFIKK